MDDIVRTQVLVVGAGPCGTTIANLLGVYGIESLLVDKAPEVVDFPRGVGVDDESLRVFQSAGLGETVHADMIQNQLLRYFDSSGRYLVEIAPSAQPFGWPRRNSFLQPMLEKKLRTGLDRFAHVGLRVSTELLTLEQDDEGVTARMRDGSGEEFTVRADYVVGADGGRSTVRKLVGATLEGSTLGARWLVVDLKDAELHAPYAGNYISSTRPHVSIDLPFGYRRFEFRLAEHETDEEMLKPGAVEHLIRKHFDWDGPMPGLERGRIYQHHSRVADRFRTGRVFLAGDAAHLQPPWFGQGMNSGIRDAANVAWKLAAVLAHGADDRILDTYHTERHGHAKAMVDLATTLGKVYSPKTKLGERARSLLLRASVRVPSARDYILQMKFKPMPFYRQGVVAHRRTDDASPVGKMFIQPAVETEDGTRLRLDDAVGPWFAVIGINIDPADHLSEESAAYWRSLGAQLVRVNRSRAGKHLRTTDAGTLLLDDTAGGFRDWHKGDRSREIVVLRPDRYLAATCAGGELDDLTARFRRIVPVREPAVRT
ncbi:bifunctional 3-(3-hydroxy-phenyl)propionate/3-hydroxycinnamic acid hydroxylase [Streptomyces sp. NPDC085927]|uniref:bifunctional 3-(3-hydroxy-phenyl)propionate/3-hydroxycinnamic acid hydroxylase n=1 Tax=Streptomyces sp. NPDC085927 TaxID=3365738 RepID=UPI0037D64629